MRIPRFYLNAELTIGKKVSIADATAHYAINVLRLKPDSQVVVFNGAGGEYEGKICSVQKKCLEIEIEKFDAVDRESPLKTQLAIGISKGDRMDWVVQKSTELGVSTIQPLYTDRTEVKLKGDRLEKKLAHWQQVSISACEQSQRTRLPQIFLPLTFTQFCQQCDSDKKIVLHADNSKTVFTADSSIASVTLLIGPEGGFTDVETSIAVANYFQLCSLGERVLRTETAPIVALSLAQMVWGDFK